MTLPREGEPIVAAKTARVAIAALMILSPVCFIILGYFYVLGIHPAYGFLRDGAEYVLGRDFNNSWMMGRAALHEAHPALNYDIPTYSAKLRAMFGPDYRWQQWSYPPSYMLLVAPFGLMPYVAAWLVFMAVSVALFGVAVWRVCRPMVGMLITSPAAFICLVSGQVSLLAAALQLAMFRLLDTRPVMAGMLLGLLSLKPQLGLVYPFFLIATRRWKVFMVATITTVAIAAVTAAIFGTEIWRAYVLQGIPLQNHVLQDPVDVIRWLMPTVFMDLRQMGASYALAMAAQILVALVAIGVLFTGAFRRAQAGRQMLIVAAAGVLVTPYLMAYDMLFFTCALGVYLRHAPRVSVVGVVLIAGCFFLPFIHYIIGQYHAPGSSLLPLILLLWLSREKPWPSVSA